MKSYTCGLRHPHIRRIIDLQKNRTPNKKNLFILEGIWAHKRLLHTKIVPETFLYCPEMFFRDDAYNLYNHFIKISKKTFKISEKALCRIASRKKPDGILSICQFPHYTYSHIRLKHSNLVLVLDGLEKPGNIGTLVRSLNGINGDGVFICNRRVRLTHPKIVKSSCGTVLCMPVIECSLSEVHHWLLKHHFTIYLAICDTYEPVSQMSYSAFAEPRSLSIRCYSRRIAIVLGNERYGISKSWYEIEHKKITVPMKGQIDSYNVAVAGSIIMYEAAKSIYSYV